MLGPSCFDQKSIATLLSANTGQRASIRRRRKSKNGFLCKMRQLPGKTTINCLRPHIGNSVVGNNVKKVSAVMGPADMGVLRNLWEGTPHLPSEPIEDSDRPASRTRSKNIGKRSDCRPAICRASLRVYG